MQTPLIIHRHSLIPTLGVVNTIHKSKRLAFLLCIAGNIDFEIMNHQYHFESNGLMICLPFANIKLLNVRHPSDIIIIEINSENVIGLSPSHRSVISNNLLLVRQNPVVKTSPGKIQNIMTEVEKYLSEIEQKPDNESDDTCMQVYKSIFEARSQLIISQLLQLYFGNIPKHLLSHNNKDLVFQRFMLDLYTNYKEHHDVRFYALRSGLSRKYFSTIVRELSGATPSEWIESTIMGETQTLLHNPHYTIKEIAFELHFPDAASFTRYVARVTGMTPKLLRKTLLT